MDSLDVSDELHKVVYLNLGLCICSTEAACSPVDNLYFKVNKKLQPHLSLWFVEVCWIPKFGTQEFQLFLEDLDPSKDMDPFMDPDLCK